MATKTLGIDSQGSQGVPTSADSTPAVTSSGASTQSTLAKPSIAHMQLDTPVMPTTAQSSRIVTDTPTVASSKPIPTPDVGTTTLKPVSTAAAPEVPAAAASTVRPYDRKTSWKSFRENFTLVAKANKWTTKEEQVQHLALALMGPAAEILRGFDDSADKALDDLFAGTDKATSACITTPPRQGATANRGSMDVQVGQAVALNRLEAVELFKTDRSRSHPPRL